MTDTATSAEMEDKTKAGSASASSSGENFEDLKRELEETKRERDAVKANRDELLVEKKKAVQALKEKQEEQERRSKERMEEDGRWEQLYKSSNSEIERLKGEIKTRDQREQEAQIHIEASKIANRLADGHNAEILTDYLVQRIKYSEDGFKVTDASGALTHSTLSDLELEFAKSEKYKSLRKGSRATGGSASGSGTGGSSKATEIVDRATFNTMKPKEQSDLYKRGGVVKD